MTYLMGDILNFLFLTKNRKIVAANCIKKNARRFSVVFIRQKYVTIKHSGKLFNIFFLKNEKLQTKLLL